MSKQSKARNKAYRKAAEHEAALQDYDSLSTAALEEWIKEYIDRHQETWNVVWSAANKWTNKWWVARTMAARDTAAKAEETLTRLEANLEAVTATAALRLDKIRKQKEQIDQQMTANVALNRTNSDLRAQLDRLKRDFVELGTNTRTRALDQVIEKNRDLVRENESLIKTNKVQAGIIGRQRAELRRVKTLLADSEEKVTYLKDLNNRLHVDLAVTRVQARRKVD